MRTLAELESINVFEKIKLSILKIEKRDQVESTKSWISLFLYKYNDYSKYIYLNNYLQKMTIYE